MAARWIAVNTPKSMFALIFCRRAMASALPTTKPMRQPCIE
jgi:hypothetical protein